MNPYENWIMAVANKTENPKVAIKVILVQDLFNQNPQAYKLMEEAGQTKFGEEAFNTAAGFLQFMEEFATVGNYVPTTQETFKNFYDAVENDLKEKRGRKEKEKELWNKHYKKHGVTYGSLFSQFNL